MKPLFVRFQDGRRHIAWTRLLTSCVLVIALPAALLEGGWYLATGHVGLAALLASLVPGTLFVTRMLARALSFQEQEQESVEEVPVASA
jgi:hypothetical protein